MQIAIEIDEKTIQDVIVTECIRYVKEKQMSQMLGIIAKQVAQEIKSEVIDSGIVKKRVEETVKRVENTLMARVNRQFTNTMDKAMEINAKNLERKAPLNMDAKSVRDHILSALIGFQNAIGCDEESETYKAYQKTIQWIEETYGPLMS